MLEKKSPPSHTHAGILTKEKAGVKRPPSPALTAVLVWFSKKAGAGYW
jgi:hypothetical protein